MSLRTCLSLVIALALAPACGGKSAGPAAPAAAPQSAPLAAEPVAPAAEATCEDACTDYAMCHEEVHGGDFSGGGACVSDCDEKDEAARAAYLRCIAEAGDCAATLAC